jgi:hypothetical protein
MGVHIHLACAADRIIFISALDPFPDGWDLSFVSGWSTHTGLHFIFACRVLWVFLPCREMYYMAEGILFVRLALRLLHMRSDASRATARTTWRHTGYMTEGSGASSKNCHGERGSRIWDDESFV